MENEEIIVKAEDLKLRIQAVIMQDIDLLKDTDDLGYTSWLSASRVVNDIICEKKNRKNQKFQKIHRKKNLIDFILPKL